jgi:tol-pal system protein YbgF
MVGGRSVIPVTCDYDESMATFRKLSTGSNSVVRAAARLLLAACATYSFVALAQTQPDTRNPGVIQLMNQIEGLQAELGKLRGQLEVLSNGLDNAQKRQRDMYLDLDTRLRRIEQQTGDTGAKADGRASDLEARIKKLEQQGAADGKDRDPQVAELEARIKRLEQAAGVSGAIPAPVATTATPPPPTTAAPTPPVKPTPPTAPTVATVAPSEQSAARKAYDSAFAAYRAGDYQGAIAAFEGIVKRYPRDPLAANAQYWIGDAWFNLRDFKSAAAAQQLLITNYPDSPKVPDALLNLGSVYAAMGDSASARKALEELIARFPQTEAAEKGKARLARLK